MKRISLFFISKFSILTNALIILCLYLPSYAIVDMQNANFSRTNVDINVANSPLKITRTYSSRSLFSGIFGFGQCSNLETSLEILSQNQLKVKTCGSGLEVVYVLKSQKGSKKTYVSKSSSSDIITTNGRSYHRAFKSKAEQWFSRDGALLLQRNSGGSSLSFEYKDNNLVKVKDETGKTLKLVRSGKYLTIKGPQGIKASYFIERNKLKHVTDQWGNKYEYDYDRLNNMKMIKSAKGIEKISYNTEKDWVTSFTDKSNCIENYNYKVRRDKKGQHKGHLATIEKKCGKDVVNKSSYDFSYKKIFDSTSKNSSSYLHKMEINIQGRKKVIVFHKTLGTPSSVLENGVLTKFWYNSKGLLSKKKSLTEEHAFKYNHCNKVFYMKSSYYKMKSVKLKAIQRSLAELDVKKARGKVLKNVKTNFKYKKGTCNLRKVFNSEGRIVFIKYKNNQITELFDQSLKKLKISYDKQTGRIKRLTVVGLGSIEIAFQNNKARIVADKKNRVVIANQIGGIFNNLISVIKPAKETSI